MLLSMSQAEAKPDNSDSIPTRATLLGRLKNWEDADSWQDFSETYTKLIYGVARQSGLTDAEARDVVQETLVGVAKKIHEFESSPERGSFKNWLLNITRWRIADHYRSKPPVKASSSFEEGEGTPTSERIPDPTDLDAVWEVEWKRNVFQTAFLRVCRRVKPKHAQIFELYAIQGWPVTKVSSELGVSTVLVYLVAHRLTRALKAEVDYVRKKLD
jgi:RNA polymerase sigma factor (sigma-70 family)